MKKTMTFFLLFNFICHFSAYSEPRDGDTIEFIGYRGNDPTKLTLREVASVSQFNYETGECIFKSEMFEFGKKIDESIRTLKIDDVFSEEKGEDYVANCEKNGGVEEILQTPAGIFKTCLIKMASLSGGESLFNISPTPLSTAKYVSEENPGERITMTLVNITRGIKR